jgi:hypothetical protein
MTKIESFFPQRRRIREIVTPLHDVLSTGPKVWGGARAAAWLAMRSIDMLEERLKAPVVDWDHAGADVIITVSGIEQLVAQWRQVLGS